MALTPIKITQQDRINRLNNRRKANELASTSAVPPVAPLAPATPVAPTVTSTVAPKPNNILSVTDRGGMDAPIEQRNPYAKNTLAVGGTVPVPGNNSVRIDGVVPEKKTNTIDYNTASLDDLEDELIRTKYNIEKKGIQSADDLISLRKLERAMQNRKQEAQASQTNLYTTELQKQLAETEAKKKAKSDELNAQNLSQLELFKKNQQALLDTTISDINDSATRQRNATVGNLAQKGFARSSATEQAEIRAEENRQRAIAAATAQRDLAIQQEQARLDGDSAEVLSAYDEQINQLGRNIGSYKQQSALEAQAGKEEAGANFATQMQQLLSASRDAGIEIDPNDEKVIEQYIRIARNTDGSVNKEAIASLSEDMQAIITAGVQNGIGIEEEEPFEAKIERIGGTTKAPIYGYYDPEQGKVVSINGTNYTPGQTITVRGGGGGVSSGGGASSGGGVVSNGYEGLGLSDAAINILKLMDIKGGTPIDYVPGQSQAQQKLRNEVYAGLNAKGGRTDLEVNSLKEALGVIKSMQDNKDYKEFGYSSKFPFMKSTTSYADMVARANQVNAILTEGNLSLMKGVLTDNDLNFLKAMSGGLTAELDISEKQAKDQIDKIYNKIQNKLSSVSGSKTTNTNKQNTNTINKTQSQTNSTQSNIKDPFSFLDDL